MAKLISKTYGDALYELAIESNSIDELVQEVVAVRSILDENRDFSRVMNHPKISKEEKIDFMETVFKGRVSDDLIGFLRIIIVNGRYAETDNIFRYFIERVKELKNIGTAYVTTAVMLNEVQKARVEERLLATTRYVKMDIHFEVDTALIGGMVIRIKDRVLDSSIRSKLARMTADLTKLQLA